jgi:hypothetical protein
MYPTIHSLSPRIIVNPVLGEGLALLSTLVIHSLKSHGDSQWIVEYPKIPTDGSSAFSPTADFYRNPGR